MDAIHWGAPDNSISSIEIFAFSGFDLLNFDPSTAIGKSMPFSIRRLAHLNRSNSVQSKDSDVGGSGGGKKSTPSTTVTTTSSSGGNENGSSPNPPSYANINPKIQASSSSSAAAAAAGKSSSTSGKSSSTSKSGSKSAKKSKHKTSQSSASDRSEIIGIIGNKNHRNNTASPEASSSPSSLVSPPSQQSVPPSFVIRNQGNIGSAFQPPASIASQQSQQSQQRQKQLQQQQQQQQSSSPSLSQGGGKSAESAIISNSRSFESNEIRRFNASNQSNLIYNAQYGDNPAIGSATPPEQTLREWNNNNNKAIHRAEESSSGVRIPAAAAPAPAPAPATGPKRVHYAAHTFARASSLAESSGFPAPSSSTSSSAYYVAANANDSEIMDRSGAIASTAAATSATSRPRMILARQASINTPTGGTSGTSGASVAYGAPKNSQNQSLPPYPHPLYHQELQQQAGGRQVLASSSPITGNGSQHQHQQTASSSISSPMMNLPRGGEEVLINGGGHSSGPKTRSSAHTSAATATGTTGTTKTSITTSTSSAINKSTAAARHHAKYLYASSSIDVAVTESMAADRSTNKAPDAIDSGRNGSNRQTATAQSTSGGGKQAPSSHSNKTTENGSSNSRESTGRQAKNSTGNNQPEQSSSYSSSTLPANIHGLMRPSSATPLERNYHYQYHPTGVNIGGAGIPGRLFEDDPGIMSEIETSATGTFRRGNKIRASLPIVRTPSKSQDRSLGLVFLQFRSETKRALLPNEITSIDTVKALFVRSFPRQLSMPYLDHASVRVYIHDSAKDMFYELEDLRDVKDRSILRIYEQGVNGPQPGGGAGLLPASLSIGHGLHQSSGGAAPPPPPLPLPPLSHHDIMSGENYGYFSEPEFDSEFQAQHVHRKRFPPPPPPPPPPHPPQSSSSSLLAHSLLQMDPLTGGSQYYGTVMLPPQFRSATLGLRPSPSAFLPPAAANLGVGPGGQNHPLAPPPQPPTRGAKAFPGYSQTLPRGVHLMSPSPINASMSHNLFGIHAAAGQAAPPPKPQRSFAGSPGVTGAGQPGGLILIQQNQQGQPGQSRSIAGAIIPSSVAPHQLPQYHQSRPLPDRPYSVAGNYPSPVDRIVSGAGGGARLLYNSPNVNNNNSAEFHQSGYISSPEHHRPPTNSAAMIAAMQAAAAAAAAAAASSGQSNRTSFAGPGPGPGTIYHHANRPGPFDTGDMAPVYPHPAAAAAAAIAAAAAAAASSSQRAQGGGGVDEDSRIRMQEMERQIASLTNVVSKALSSSNTAKSGSKPAPPPKPQSLIGYRGIGGTNTGGNTGSGAGESPLRQIRRRARDLRAEIGSLKRFALQQTTATKADLRDACQKIHHALSFLARTTDLHVRLERLRVSHDRESYHDDVRRLDHDLAQLETQVEELRSNVINRRCRVNISNVESMAIVLSRASKTVADLKTRYPSLAQGMKAVMSKELQQIDKEEKFLKEEPDRLEHSLKRCKKLTGTLVTLKRLASVQEQRSSTNASTCSPSQLLQAVAAAGGESKTKDGSLDDAFSSGGAGGALSSSPAHDAPLNRSYDSDLINPHPPPHPPPPHHHQPPQHTIIHVTPATPLATGDSTTMRTRSNSTSAATSSGTILDNLLDELQTFSKQQSISGGADDNLRSMDSLAKRSGCGGGGKGSTSDSGGSNKQNQPPNNSSDTIVRKARSKSYSSLRANSEPPGIRARGSSIPDGTIDLDGIALLAAKCSTASSSAAAAAAALMEKRFAQSRQELLEQRHQELLRKQRQLQEQYTRLQQLSRGQFSRALLGGGGGESLKKTGSESNLLLSSKLLLSSPTTTTATATATTIDGDRSSSSGSGGVASKFDPETVKYRSTVHGSLKNLSDNCRTTQSTGIISQKSSSSPPPEIPQRKQTNESMNEKNAIKTTTTATTATTTIPGKKVFETDIL